MNFLDNISRQAAGFINTTSAQNLTEVREARQGLEAMKGLRKYPVIALVASVAIALFGILLSSTFLAVTGLVLVAATAIAVSDCNRVCERIDYVLHQADSGVLNALAFNALLIQAKRDKNLAKQLFKSLFDNTLVFKRFF